ncbi:MAG: phage terminase large subunit, partial [Alphaproteobacteria bacterium]
MDSPTLQDFVEAWNVEQNLTTPDLHRHMLRWLSSHWDGGQRELLLMAFRNSGKSTLVGLFSAWLLKCNPDLRIIVLAADLALARKMVRNVKRVIERHPLCEGMRPKRLDQWASDQFTVNRPSELRDPSMLARGVVANVTGSRADVVICDDVEVPNTCNTAPKRADLRQRLEEIDYVLVPGGTQLYVGTPHSYYTLYARNVRSETGEEDAFLANFERLELPLLDEGGNSRWPERFADDGIAALKRRHGPNKFASQMMLDPVNIADGRLDPDRLRFYDDDLDYREGNSETTLTLGDKRLVSASC